MAPKKHKTPPKRRRKAAAAPKGTLARLEARRKAEARPSDDPTRNGRFEVQTDDLAIKTVDPRTGEAVISEIRTVTRILNAWPLDRMFRNGTIDPVAYRAGGLFRDDYELAGMAERLAASNLSPLAGCSGGGKVADLGGNLAARRRIRDVLDCMSHDMASAMEWIVGNGHALSQWVQRMRWGGRTLNEHFARGLVVGGLDIAATVYGLRKVRHTIRPARPSDPTPHEVDAIRKARADGATVLELFRAYRFPVAVIARIVEGDDDIRRAERDAHIRAAIRDRLAGGDDPETVAILFNVTMDFVGDVVRTTAP
ncbi:hypothetical protein M2352_003909 [Azospirillum fermentarium]|uniref:DUF6456 domain-containing protein n=1 Tax=Azospirillum fermentarium TaxID=1233114 RepID=UPI002225C853|nr:DUF6456 domain-containing protein [Azospirillum fermentarium]MCW2248275.1 hypothetical protein [Azospirillum fermentarium]